MVAGFVSLCIGIAAVVWYTAIPQAEIRVISTPAESSPNCKESKSYPGRSLALPELKKNQRGILPGQCFQ